MRRSRVTLTLALAATMLLPAWAGCLDSGSGDDGPTVVTSIYPLRFLATRIAGDNVTVTGAAGEGVTPHGWEPTARDLARLARADVLIVQGLGFEPWLPGALASLGSDAPPVVTASENLSLLQARADHVHEEDEDSDAHANETEEEHDAHEADEEEWDGTGAPDPHTWLDPVRFREQARHVERALATTFPEHAAAFAARADALDQELAALDAAFEDGLDACDVRVVIVSHNAFTYLADRYEFDVLSVHGLSPTTEPDARTVRRLVDAARELNVTTVFTEELADPRVVRTVAEEVGAAVRVLSPVEGVTSADAALGVDYLTIQRQNLQNLREGMRCT